MFLDRDGVISRERGYVTEPEQLEILPGVPAALRELAALGFVRLIVTNQSAIARGLLSWSNLQAIHRHLRAEAGGVDGIYVCPHHAREGHTALTRACRCRKPADGLLRQAAREHGVTAARCWMVGDAPRDIEAARSFGARALLVLGPRIETADAYPSDAAPPDAFVRDLPEAVRFIRDAGPARPLRRDHSRGH